MFFCMKYIYIHICIYIYISNLCIYICFCCIYVFIILCIYILWYGIWYLNISDICYICYMIYMIYNIYDIWFYNPIAAHGFLEMSLAHRPWSEWLKIHPWFTPVLSSRGSFHWVPQFFWSDSTLPIIFWSWHINPHEISIDWKHCRGFLSM